VLSDSKNNDDIMIIMESDQTSEINLVKPLVSKIRDEGNDIVIASRYIKGGGYANFPFLRRVFSLVANKLMQFYFPLINVRDYTIFFRAYRTGVLREAVKYFGQFGLIQSRSFCANAELLIKLSLFTKRINEIPFIYNYAKKGGGSKIRIFSTVLEYFSLILYLKAVFKKVKGYKNRGKNRGAER
jgi:dolichol-phosphate mannosyltransferase